MQLNRHTYLYTILFAVISAAVLTSCGSSGDTSKPVTRTEKMGDVFIEITENEAYLADPDTAGKQASIRGTVRPTSMNGKKIYTINDKKVQPAITPAGQLIVDNLHNFLRTRMGSDTAKSKIYFDTFVIDEKGKVVYYITGAEGGDTTSMSELLTRGRPILDSLQPVLLSITFEPAEVNGVAVPYLLTRTIK